MIHATVIDMLHRMLDPEEFQKVIDDISYIPVGENELPFMTLDFADGNAILDDIPDPKESYIWN